MSPDKQSFSSESSSTVSPVIEVRNLNVHFPQGKETVHAVKDLSFSVAPGEVLSIVGESGSGKSVSTQAITGLLPENAAITGSITFAGKELLGLTDKQLSHYRGNKIGVIFQDPLTSLTPIYTIGAQIAEALLIHNPHLSKKQVQERVIELLTLVDIPDPHRLAGRFPHQFSGGMRQRVAIAIAIANNPQLIIADEPTTALDVTVQAQILGILHRAKEHTGAAVILITHDLGVVAGVADRALVMFRGKHVESASVEELFYAPRSPYTQGLLQAIPRIDQPTRTRLTPVTVAQEQAALNDVMHSDDSGISPSPPNSQQQTHDEAHKNSTPESSSWGDTILTVNNLHKFYRITPWEKFHAVQGISFSIRERETFAIVGESGSGKTTAIMEIMKLQCPDEGKITLFEHDYSHINRKERKKLRSHIQIVFQDPMSSLDPRLPVSDIIAEPLRIAKVPPPQQQQRIKELIDYVGIPTSALQRYPTQFSGGQRQRIGIARAIALQPKLLVLDEPTSALDVSIQASVLNLLHDLQEELNLGYLFVSHNLSVVKNMADSIGVMRRGSFVEQGTTEEIFSHPQHPYTIALIEASPIPDPRIQKPRLLESARLVDALS